MNSVNPHFSLKVRYCVIGRCERPAHVYSSHQHMPDTFVIKQLEILLEFCPLIRSLLQELSKLASNLPQGVHSITPEEDNILHWTCKILPVSEMSATAHHLLQLKIVSRKTNFECGDRHPVLSY